MKDLAELVKSWIQSSGFSLEMSVAGTLRKLGFSVVQSEYFKDPVSGESRETDVVAIELEVRDEVFLNFEIICECKTSLKHPWVLFSSGSSPRGALGSTLRATTKKGRRPILSVLRNRAARQSGLFSLPNTIGYSLTTAFPSGPDGKGKQARDGAYDAVSAVSAATVAFINQAEAADEIVIAWPILVLRGRLFQAALSATSEVEVEEIDRGVLGWRNPLMARQSFLAIVVEESFEARAEELLLAWRKWSPEAVKALEKLVNVK